MSKSSSRKSYYTECGYTVELYLHEGFLLDNMDDLSDPDALIDASSIIKDDNYVKAGIFSVDGKNIFIKKYKNRDLLYSIKNLFRISKAEKYSRISEVLRESGVCFPEFYGYIKKTKKCLNQEIFLLTEKINDIASDEFYLKNVFYSEQKLKMFCSMVIELLSNLHNTNIFHGDCKLHNFFINQSKEGFSIGIWDFDGTEIYSKISIAKRGKDLGRFITAIFEFIYEQNLSDIITKDLLVKYVADNYSFEGNKNRLECAVMKSLNHHLQRKGLEVV